MGEQFRYSLRSLLVALTAAAFLCLVALFVWRFMTMDLSLSPKITLKPFDAREWAAWSEKDMLDKNPERAYSRRAMVQDLLATHNFNGWTEDRVKSLLGEPMDNFQPNEEWQRGYLLGSDWVDYLILVFHFDTAGQVDDYTIKMY